MHKSYLCFLIALAMATGCGSGDLNPPSQSASTVAAASKPTDPIARVAYQFFDAVLASDRDAARAQLTTVAVQRLEQLGMDFLLPISETSKFSIGQPEVIEQNMAAVDAVLTEVDSAGKSIREEITVVLRLDQGRWGVMGVVTGMGPNEQLDGFNFEKPDQPFTESSFDRQPTTNIAAKPQPTNVPQQASRPAGQDPFRQ